jgi:hypothetical protein
MRALTLETQIRQHPGRIASEADGEEMFMHVGSGNYFGLNEVASFIWNQLETPRTVGELCDAVLAEFDVEPEQCQADALEFLRGMIDDGLAEVVPETEAA